MMKQQKYNEAAIPICEHLQKHQLCNALSLLAQCAYGLGRYDDVPELVAASSLGFGPVQQHVLHLAGLSLLKTGKCEEAYLSLQRALTLRPECAKIREALKDVAKQMQTQSNPTVDAPSLWQYQKPDGRWNDMSLGLSEELESAFADYQANPQSASITVTTGGRAFDFGKMKQRNLASGRWRRMRRHSVAAMVHPSSVTGKFLQTCLSRTAGSYQVVAAADDLRTQLTRQLGVLEEQEASLKNQLDAVEKLEASLKIQFDDLKEQEASLKHREQELQQERQKDMELLKARVQQTIQQEVETQMAEFEANMSFRSLQNAASALSLEGAEGRAKSIIYEQRQELEFWRSSLNAGGEDRLLDRLGFEKVMFIEDDTLLAPLQRLLRGTAEPHRQKFQGQESRCKVMSKAQVHRVLRVVNPELWKQYQEQKLAMQQGPSPRFRTTPEIELLKQIAFNLDPKSKNFGATYWICCDGTVNEMLLFHGTNAANAESIAKDGFDPSRVRNGLYGNGFYFACEACKSFQYSKPNDQEHCIIVARVLLGKPKLAERPLKGKAEILENDENSVVVLPRNVPGQAHNEFVVFDQKQIFPEFIIYFKT